MSDLKKTTIIAMIIILFLSITMTALAIKRGYDNSRGGSTVSSYQACIDKGYPVLESYPSVCKIPGGSSFTNPTETSLPPTQK